MGVEGIVERKDRISNGLEISGLGVQTRLSAIAWGKSLHLSQVYCVE